MYASQGASTPSRDMLGLESPFAETLDPINEAFGTTDLAEAWLEEAQDEELGRAGTTPPKSFLGGSLWSFRSQACATPVALFVPPAARGRETVDVMLVVHGLLHVCARPKKVPEGLISDVPLNVGKTVADSGLPMVVVAPLLQSSGQGWSAHNLNRPATLNALFAEALAEVGRNLDRPALEIGRLVIAGHSKAYEVLYPLARNHRSPELARGALARLSNVWVLDATYGVPPNGDFAALASAKPGLRVDIVYRASTRNKASPTDKYRGRSQDGRVSLLPISAEAVSHCAIPARILPKLISDLPAAPSSESLDNLQFSAWEQPSGEGLDWLEPQAEHEPLDDEPETGPFEAEDEANAVREAGVRAVIRQVRTAGTAEDRLAIRQTLEARGTSIESWFGDHVVDASFCGLRIAASGGNVAGVHRTLLDALKRAENALLARYPGLGAAALARQLGIKRIVGLRPPKKATGGTLPSRHCFGLAIDINHPTNPFVGNQKARDPKFRENRSPAIIRRAMKLLRGEDFDIERTPIPSGAGAAWDMHDRASRTLAEYLQLADQVNSDRVVQLVEAARRAGDPRSLEDWKRWIVTDRRVIKNWDFAYHPAPERGGYMDLPRELVVALGDAGLIWGGQFYGAKDIMHFHLTTLERQQPRREAFDAAEEESSDAQPEALSSDADESGESEALAWLDFEEPGGSEAIETDWTARENFEPEGPNLEESFDTFEQEEAPSNAFKDCSIAQRKLLVASADRARRALVWAEKYVADAHGRPNKMSATVRSLLLEHFHTTERRNLRDILTKLFKLRKQFEKGIRFECEGTCPRIDGKVLQGQANRSQWFGGWGNVHICFGGGFDFADPGISDKERDILVIHEVAHRYLGIDDKAYFDLRDAAELAKYRKLTAKQAMDNADSYAAFAVEMNAARPKFIREEESEGAWLGEEMPAYEEGLDAFGEDPESEELALLEERRLDPSVMDIAERVMAGEQSFFEGEAPKRWTSCFSAADVGRVDKVYQDNVTAADANSNDRCSCIVMLNVGLGQLLSLATKSHPARDPAKTTRRVEMAKLPTETIEKAMAKLRSLGNAGARRDIWFLDRRGRRATSLKPERLQSSVETIVKTAATTKGCWYGFGLSLLDGYHSVMLLVDRTGDTPRIYWLDQFKNGVVDDVTGTLDDRITERTQTFWQGVWDDKKKAYNGVIRLWPLRKRAS